MLQLSRNLRTAAPRWAALLLLAGLLVGVLAPVAAQDATAVPTTPPPTAIPTDGPPPEGPVTTVNGVALSAADFQDRVRLTRFLYSYTIRETLAALVARGTPAQDAFRAVQQFYSQQIGGLLVADLLADSVLDTMEEDEVLAQLAAAQGIEVTDADVDAQLAAYVGQAETIVGGATADPEATAEATEAPAATEPDLLAAMLAEAAERVNVSEEAVRAFFRGQALRDAWMDEVNGPFPTEWPVISARHILVETEAEANDVLARLEAGEDFAAVAQDVSIDTVSAAQGGALEPAVPETYVGPFADAVRDAEVGVLIGPVQSEYGYHIIEVTERSDQPVSDEGRRALLRTRSEAFQTWLEEQVAGAEIARESSWPSMIPNQPTGQELLQSMLEGM